MARQKTLLKILGKSYRPNSIVNTKYKEHYITFRTDAQGNPVTMIIGDRLESGEVSGDRFVRTLIKDSDGKIIKDQWDLKSEVIRIPKALF